MIEWHGKPTSDDGTAEVRGSVDESHEPGTPRALVGDSKLMLVPDLGPVDDRLIFVKDPVSVCNRVASFQEAGM